MNALVTDLNLPAPDEFYEALIALHRGLSEEQSALVNAKLVLLLANHVGDPQVLREAMDAAREDVVAGEAPVGGPGRTGVEVAASDGAGEAAAPSGSAGGEVAASTGADPSRSAR